MGIRKLPIPRPTFHFTPQFNWMNDPNGLVFDRGLWHLYFQYNPEGPDWGNMSWGHASSTDLQNWTEHPVALPYRKGEQIYSGSVVATQADGDSLLTAYYTSAYENGRQAQSRATSSDSGFTWQQDPQNPVLDRGTNAFRDPKVIRYTDDHGDFRWIMLAVEAEDRQVLFYSSADLRSWTFQSTFGPLGDDSVVWECPDLVPLPVDGDPNNIKWVLFISKNPVGEDADPDGSSMSYIIGDFDGTAFTAETTELLRLDHGRDFYAGVTFDNAPGNAAIMIAWMSNWRYAGDFPSTPWRGSMSLPRQLSLRTVGGVARLVQEPPEFIRTSIAESQPAIRLDSAQPLSFAVSGHSLIELQWDPVSTGTLRLKLQGDADAHVSIEHSPTSGTLHITRQGREAQSVHADFPSTSTVPVGGTAPVRLLLSLDGPLLEVFVNDGESTVSNLVVLGSGNVTATITTDERGQVAVATINIPALDAPATVASADTSESLV
jgi:fructan beta-fructosidase